MTTTSNKPDDKAIFNVARQIDSPAARADYLRQACGTDVALRDQVHELLNAYEEQASFLESPPAAAFARTVAGPPSTEPPGTVIGPYKLLEQIGEGGMGTVYHGRAERAGPTTRCAQGHQAGDGQPGR